MLFSRTASMSDVLINALGIAAGYLAASRWRTVLISLAPLWRRKWALAAVTLIAWGAAIAMIIALLCMDWETVLTDRSMALKRLNGFWEPPFASLYWLSELEALSNILSKSAMWAALGALPAIAVRLGSTSRTHHRAADVAAILLLSSIGVGVECLQAWLPPHVPSLTDCLLYATGSWVGVTIVRYCWPAGLQPSGDSARFNVGV
ncbi:VanZ like family protein [Pseudobythopirellula maris]|uniref:VanZ like family protein n=2 Tax=Pseudobythopirellula maris TaxID=2527991 RepID=A0A5C5ZQE2_9BACT|nr:VanZ like family protein [Pseudobythopirellula maris]